MNKLIKAIKLDKKDRKVPWKEDIVKGCVTCNKRWGKIVGEEENIIKNRE